MSKQIRLILKISIILFLALSSGCSSNNMDTETNYCIQPESFSLVDIIGTWEYKNYISENAVEIDTLVIRSDGFYQQVLSLQNPKIYYMSEWLPWQLKEIAPGNFRLYIEGMNLCLYLDVNHCEEINEGFTSSQGMDVCLDEFVITENAGYFIIAREPRENKQLVDKIKLFTLRVFTDGGINSYEKVNRLP